ncbi:MAG TPA: PIN domain-containing protein [Candidatus Omnitrophica bacterium]|nr:PIN domain-containing protein [Candidatus Omnitrophota bacterium]
MRKLKLYIETSVWNFFFADDAPEKKEITREFFNSITKGVYEIFISEVVIEEINNAPKSKKLRLFSLINKYNPINLEITEETEELAELYLNHRVLPPKKNSDALHVAIATVFEMDALITWNYSHLANLRKAELFNGVNLEKGFTKKLEIVTPMEVSKYEDR